jgi:hypothetical protein
MWSTRVSVAAVVFGLAVPVFTFIPAFAGTTPCDSSLSQCTSGECFGQGFQLCRSTAAGCACVAAGCCEIDSPVCANMTAAECGKRPFHPNAFCGTNGCVPTATPSATPTTTPTATASGTPPVTATATATATKVPNGGECMDPSQCASGICANGMCESATAPVPAASSTGLLVAVAVLIGLGGVALLRRLRRGDAQ